MAEGLSRLIPNADGRLILVIRHRQDAEWMDQQARNVTLEDWGFLKGCRYLPHEYRSGVPQCWFGNFAPPNTAPIITTVQLDSSLGLNVGSLAVGDFNKDGIPDLVVATIAGNQASIVLLGNGDGTFATPHTKFIWISSRESRGSKRRWPPGFGVRDEWGLGVSLGNGDGRFGAMTGLPSASFPGLYLGLAVADFNGDRKLDIAATDFGSPFGGFGTLVFYAGDGDGTFAAPTAVPLAISSFPGSLASGDFNPDGKQDLLVAFPAAAFIVFGNGDGTFNQGFDSIQFVYAGNFATFSTNAVTVFAEDLTHIGRFDAVTSDFDTGTLQIALNNAIGFSPTSPGIFSFYLGPGLADIAAGDLNGDGMLDVVVINYQTSEIRVALSHKHG